MADMASAKVTDSNTTFIQVRIKPGRGEGGDSLRLPPTVPNCCNSSPFVLLPFH